MIGGLFGRRRASPNAASVKAWVEARFALGPDDVVSIAELACRDDGCPDLETVVTVMHGGGGAAKWRIEKPLAAVTQADIAALGDEDD
ncbi:hypothetical protein [Rubrimonas cliftonensis]|uniref:Nitrate reductase n=1 Tax=Rubrimonas cliftonensis TaxID=89524 RepID=A0A1H4G8G0_9RHOB|nr:hypothetical protein [Rubrimonas cliftonensis]SEB05943.1 hypothetical protein SAMN05444370_1432 [Rubrimonas cliftonensis]